MTYEEARDEVLSWRDAKREILSHGCVWKEFLEDVGDKLSYNGKEVLDWLGY